MAVVTGIGMAAITVKITAGLVIPDMDAVI